MSWSRSRVRSTQASASSSSPSSRSARAISISSAPSRSSITSTRRAALRSYSGGQTARFTARPTAIPISVSSSRATRIPLSSE